MCVGDIRLGARIRTSSANTTVNTTSTELVGANSSRVGVWVLPPKVQRVTITIESTAVVQEGYVLTPNDEPLFFDLYRHGDLPRRQLNAISEGTSDTVQVWQQWLPEDVVNVDMVKM